MLFLLIISGIKKAIKENSIGKKAAKSDKKWQNRADKEC